MKITLMDIMESLSSNNQADAEAALHEWFVDQSKKAYGQITGQAVEEDEQPAEEQVVIESIDDDMFDALDSVANGDARSTDSGSTFFDDIGPGQQMMTCSWIKVQAETEDEIDAIDVGQHLAQLEKLAGVTPGAESENLGVYTTLETDPDQPVVTIVFAFYDAGGESEGEGSGDQGDEGSLYVTIPADVDAEAVESLVTSIVGEQSIEDAPELHFEDVFPDKVDSVKDALARASYDTVTVRFEVNGYLGDSQKFDGSPVPQAPTPTFEELVADLTEAFQGLETVSDKLQNVEGAQVGEQGKVPVNTKPTLPSKKGDKRVGGEPVEIKGKGHTGHALEKAPKVKDAPVKHHVQNSKDDPKKVTDDKSALLNKMDGSVNTQSPISGKGAKGLKK